MSANLGCQVRDEASARASGVRCNLPQRMYPDAVDALEALHRVDRQRPRLLESLARAHSAATRERTAREAALEEARRRERERAYPPLGPGCLSVRVGPNERDAAAPGAFSPHKVVPCDRRVTAV